MPRPHTPSHTPSHACAPRQLTEEERTRALAELERRETEYSRLRRQKLTVDDFEPLTIIGRGAFGEARRGAHTRRGALRGGSRRKAACALVGARCLCTPKPYVRR